MRSKEFCDFETKISEINNHLSHIIFVFKQFLIDNEVKIKQSPEAFTPHIYKANDLSTQFNVKLKDLNMEASKSLDYILDTVFVFVNTQFEVFLKDAYLFAKNNSQMNLAEPPDTKVYETVLDRIGIDIDKEIDNLFISTYEYLRFRRNAIMHRDKKRRFHGAIEDLIKGKSSNNLLRAKQLNGQELNQVWKRHSKELDDKNLKGFTIRTFDFSNRDISKFSVSDLFDIFNFFRLFASSIDKLIIQKIERKYLLDYLCKKYEVNYGTNKNITIEKFRTRLHRTNILELNLELKDNEIDLLYKKGI